MPIGALNSEIFADMFGTAAMREVFGDDALLARCVKVEAALARAQAKLGIIPAEAAEAITHAENSLTSGHETLDLARLKGETETVGYPILPLVRQLAELTGPRGATCTGGLRPRTSWIPPWCCRSATAFG